MLEPARWLRFVVAVTVEGGNWESRYLPEDRLLVDIEDWCEAAWNFRIKTWNSE
jgi:hypothetical protein